METEQHYVDVITIAPIDVPVQLRVGTDRESSEYLKLAEGMAEFGKQHQLFVPQAQSQEYQSLEQDVKDARLFYWQEAHSHYELSIHVFGNALAIAELRLKHMEAIDARSLELQSQQLSERLIAEAFPRFLKVLEALYKQLPSPLLQQLNIPSKANTYWVARCLLLQESDRSNAFWQNLVNHWLASTQHPEHAEEIISGERDHSMTWLNYVIVDPYQADYRIQTMVLAQFLYTAQQNCNQQLREAISAAYGEGRLQQAQTQLEISRVSTRLHIIGYHEHLKYLTRPKRRLLDDILRSWEFERLVENSQRMIDVCSSRLEEAEHRRRERSSMMTDLLLVALSFFTVFELSLFLTQFSREMMSRPALDYKDESTSFFLSLIAEIDADVMFGLGFAMTVLLVVVYRILKRR